MRVVLFFLALGWFMALVTMGVREVYDIEVDRNHQSSPANPPAQWWQYLD